MTKTVKILITGFLVFTIALVALIFIVSTKINPEEIRKLTKENIEKALPGSSVEIGMIDFSLGTSIRVYINEIDLSIASTKEKLARVDKLVVKLPIFAILAQGGTVSVRVEKPEVIFHEYEKGNNWEKVLPSPQPTQEKSNNDTSTNTFEIPSFISNSKVDLRVESLELKYIPVTNIESTVLLKKVVLKNINLVSTTAYEVLTFIDYNMDSKTNIKSDVQIIGEVSLKEILEKAQVKTNLMVTIDNVAMTDLDIDIPKIKNKLKVEIGKDAIIKVFADVDVDGITNLSTSIVLDKGHLRVQAFEMFLENKAAFQLLPKETRASLSMIDFAESRLKVSGDIDYKLNSGKLNQNIKVEMNKPLKITLEGLPKVHTTFNAEIHGEYLSFNTINKTLGGKVSTEVFTQIDPLNIETQLSKLKPITVNLKLESLKISKGFIQNKMYSSHGDDVKVDSTKDQVVDKGSKVQLPTININLAGENILIGKEQLAIDAKVNVKGNKVSSKHFKVKLGSGTTGIKFNSTLITTTKVSNYFNIKMEKINIDGLNAFFPPFIKDIKGKFNGDIQGDLKLAGPAMTYKINAGVSATKGELKNIDVEKFVMPLIDSISFLKGKVKKKMLNITDNFNKFEIKAQVTEKQINISNFYFSGNNQSLVAKANGNVSMFETGNSEIKGSLTIDQYAKDISKVTGQNDLPFLLKGKGFSLLPVARYTSDKLVERTARLALKKQKVILQKKLKAEKKKLKKKMDAAVKKEKKKLEEDLKKKAKNLLKGISL